MRIGISTLLAFLVVLAGADMQALAAQDTTRGASDSAAYSEDAASRGDTPIAVALATGPWHTCVLTVDSVAQCWGNNDSRQLGYDPSQSCKVSASAGPCGEKPARIEGDLRFIALAAGEHHTCGLTVSGQAFCWGSNEMRQLGVDSASPDCLPSGPGDRYQCSSSPTPAAGALRFQAIAVGANHTCGLAFEGIAYCWGANDRSQLGRRISHSSCGRKSPCSGSPVMVKAGPFVAIAAGGNQACGLSKRGSATCWGDWNRSQDLIAVLSGSAARGKPKRVPTSRRFAFMAVGNTEIVGVTRDGDSYWWGTRWVPAHVDEEDEESEYPESLIGTASDYTSITAGSRHVCAVRANGVAFCWGDNSAGQLGIGEKSPGDKLFGNLSPVDLLLHPNRDPPPWTFEENPRRVAKSIRWQYLAAGEEHTCGLSRGGRVFCWGRNRLGQVGPNGHILAMQPVEVPLAAASGDRPQAVSDDPKE